MVCGGGGRPVTLPPELGGGGPMPVDGGPGMPGLGGGGILCPMGGATPGPWMWGKGGWGPGAAGPGKGAPPV